MAHPFQVTVQVTTLASAKCLKLKQHVYPTSNSPEPKLNWTSLWKVLDAEFQLYASQLKLGTLHVI
eukprot:1141218-Amphidinium_carterae.1